MPNGAARGRAGSSNLDLLSLSILQAHSKYSVHVTASVSEVEAADVLPEATAKLEETLKQIQAEYQYKYQ